MITHILQQQNFGCMANVQEHNIIQDSWRANRPEWLPLIGMELMNAMVWFYVTHILNVWHSAIYFLNELSGYHVLPTVCVLWSDLKVVRKNPYLNHMWGIMVTRLLNHH